jgi:chemotaxis methyl-accepting protein methylase
MAVSAIVKHVGAAGKGIWQRLPEKSQERPVVRTVNQWIYGLSKRRAARNIEAQSTWFLRNEPLLKTVCELALAEDWRDSLRVCSVGCSTGAELYSLLWMLRKADPTVKISPVGVDRLESVLDKARSGQYSRQEPELRAVSEGLLRELFDTVGSEFKIKDWIAEGAQWVSADVRSAEFSEQFGQQDVVMSNNIFIHMNEPEARMGLMHLAKIVKPGGLIVCQGVDLDVREKIARELRFEAVPRRIEEIHNSDSNQAARAEWPWQYWSLEPLDKTRKHWIQRYASIFRIPRDFRIN